MMDHARRFPSIGTVAVPLGIAGVAVLCAALLALAPERRVSHAALPGLTYEYAPGADRGSYALVVTSVQDDGPADSAAIHVGDIIDRVDGRPITSAGNFGTPDAPNHHADIALRIRRADGWVDKHLPVVAE